MKKIILIIAIIASACNLYAQQLSTDEQKYLDSLNANFNFELINNTLDNYEKEYEKTINYAKCFLADENSTVIPNCNDTIILFGKKCIMYYKDTTDNGIVKYISVGYGDNDDLFEFIKGTDEQISEWMKKVNTIMYDDSPTEFFYPLYCNHLNYAYPFSYLQINNKKKYIRTIGSSRPMTWMLPPLTDREKKIGNAFANR